jgi:hypothetical protein
VEFDWHSLGHRRYFAAQRVLTFWISTSSLPTASVSSPRQNFIRSLLGSGSERYVYNNMRIVEYWRTAW